MGTRVRVCLFVLSTFMALVWPNFAGANPCKEPGSCADYLVKFAPQASQEKAGAVLSREGLVPVNYFERSQIYHVAGSPKQDKQKVLKRLNSDPAVLYAEPNYTVQAYRLPNDPQFSEQWGLRNIGQEGGTLGDDIGMSDVWDTFTGSPQIIVGVLDSGIDYRHEDLAKNMWINSREVPGNNVDDDGDGLVDDYYGYDFFDDKSDPMDDDFHGTHVAGIIGAVGNNGIGISGVNWNEKLMAIKVLGSGGSGSMSDIVAGVDYAVDHGAKVLNASWGFTTSLNGLPSDPSLEPSQALRDAIAAADLAGVIFVAAAGNNSFNTDQKPFYPGCYSLKNVVSVAATDRNDALASFSNYGPISVDLGAPGVLILSTYPSYKDRLYAYATGTSMASPHVAGAAALLWGANPGLSHRQVIEKILQGVQSDPYLQGKTVTGGRLDLAHSMQLGDVSQNHPPVANAGPNLSKYPGQTVVLNGTAIDEDGDAPLAFAWVLAKPSTSRAVLSSSIGTQVSFVPDVIGTYRATLVVSDGQSSSLPSTATISVSTDSTTPPSLSLRLKDNGLGLTSNQINIGDLISLDASGSRSSNGQPLSFRWAFIERPSGSAVLLNNASTSIASYKPDREGRYVVSLTANDGKLSSTAEVLFLASEASSIQAPVLSLRLQRNGSMVSSNQFAVGDLVSLDASGSTANGPSLSFAWSFAQRPAGSAATLGNASSSIAWFRPDKIGFYIVNVVLNNGSFNTKGQVVVSVSSTTSASVESQSLDPALEEISGESDGSAPIDEPPENAVPPNAAIEAWVDSSPVEADLGHGATVPLGSNVVLDGSGSRAEEGSSLAFDWTLVRRPEGSRAGLAGTDSPQTSFVPDLPGRYLLRLQVKGGEQESRVELPIWAESAERRENL